MQHVEDATMLQSTFDLDPTDNGGYINTGIRRIVYGENYKVESL
jgi:hypothetical protein